MTEDRCTCGRLIPSTVVDQLLKDTHLRGECKTCRRHISGASIRATRLAAPASPETLVRADDPPPSHEGAEDVVRRLTKARQYAYEAILEHPGCTANELSEKVGDRDSRRIGRRLNELEKAGAVRRGLVRECKVTGRRGATWEPII